MAFRESLTTGRVWPILHIDVAALSPKLNGWWRLQSSHSRQGRGMIVGSGRDPPSMNCSPGDRKTNVSLIPLTGNVIHFAVLPYPSHLRVRPPASARAESGGRVVGRSQPRHLTYVTHE